MPGVTFTDGQQVSGEGAGKPFPGGSMQSGGPVQGPTSDGDKTAGISITGPMPPRGNVLQSPVDNY
jgi:hypothetical protein